MIWSDSLNIWAKDNYLVGQRFEATSGKSNTYILRYGFKVTVIVTKPIFVNMTPYEGISGKKTFGDTQDLSKIFGLTVQM